MSIAPRRVLVVEDDSAQQLMYRKALQTMDFESQGATTPREALAMLAAQGFAIVILDLRLGHELSLDLFEEIRERYPAVSVVIATGNGSFDFARRSINRDVVDFLTKPIPLAALEHALDRAWSRHVLVQTPVARLRPINSPAADARHPEGTDEWLTKRPSLNIDELERELIIEALRRSADNRKLAAEMLGMSERKLYYRLTQYRVS